MSQRPTTNSKGDQAHAGSTDSDYSRRSILKKTSAAAGGLTMLGLGGASVQSDPVSASKQVSSERSSYELKIKIVPLRTRNGIWDPFRGLLDLKSQLNEKFGSRFAHLDFWPPQNSDQLGTSTGTLKEAIRSYREDMGLDEDNELIFDISQDSNCEESWFSTAKEAITEFDDEAGDPNVIHLITNYATNFANGPTAEVWTDHEEIDNYDWDGPVAYVGTAGGYESTTDSSGRIKNLAMQEVCHGLIGWEANESNSDDSIKSDGEKEHELGSLEITNTYRRGNTLVREGPVTPMATYYEETRTNPCGGQLSNAVKNGRCSYDSEVPHLEYEWNGRHTQSLTDCTLRAIENTYRNRT